jgi:hypothetical protein
LGNRTFVRSGGKYMCTCMFNYLLGQLGIGTTITRNKTKRNGLFLVTLKTLRFVSLIELASKKSMFLV